MIMSKAPEMLLGNRIPYYIWTIIIGAFVILLGIVGPLTVVKQWLEKFAIWIVYVSSTLIIINLLRSGALSKLLLSSSSPAGMSFFSALYIVIAMPVSWMPLVSDYNRFAKDSSGAFSGTFVGFAITNILFYFGGLILGVGNVVAVVAAVQSIFFGLILLMFILRETSNAFADVYSCRSFHSAYISQN
jgi:NCS1 family nucleobase:cation symporter-1